MNTIKASRLVASAFVLLFSSVFGYAADTGKPYIQLSSMLSQPAASKGPTVVSFEQVDGVSSLKSSKRDITVHVDGNYFFMMSTQVGSLNKDAPAAGYVDVWLTQNGKPIAYSNSRQSVGGNLTSVLVSQGILPLKAGDVISLSFAASDPAFGLVSISNLTNNEPNISSIDFTMYQI